MEPENDEVYDAIHQNRISVIPLGLGKQSLQRRLEAYYSLIAPDILANEDEWKTKFDLIYEKFGGSEQGEKRLAAKLCKKYGNAVRLRLISVSDGSPSSSTSPNNKHGNIAKMEESWYELNSNQESSGVVDFTSPDFDPITTLSLETSVILEQNPFIKDSPLLDNLSRLEPYLPDCDPLKRNQIQKKRNNTNVAINSVTNAQQRKRKLPIMSSIVETYEGSGPLSLLYTIHNKKQRIRVMIRYSDSIRSTLTGYLLTFDKHMNMILRDVDEVYTPRVTKVYEGMDFSKAELEIKRRTSICHGDLESKEIRLVRVKQRHFQQLLVRGDNVVMVWRASAERSSWPKTSISPDRSRYLNNISRSERENKSYCHVGTPGSLLLALKFQKPL